MIRDIIARRGMPPETPPAVGPWMIVKAIGSGGMGTVWLARDSSGAHAAVKMLPSRHVGDRSALDMFLAETRALAAVDDRHVSRSVGCGMQDGRPWLAMEHIDGPSLAALAGHDRKHAERDVLRWSMQAATGLSALAGAGIIHGDVKPGNIMIARLPGRSHAEPSCSCDLVKIIDVGIASASGIRHHRCTDEMLVGTPTYMSPERIAGRPETWSSDLYSLGVVMHRLLSGRVPFAGGDHMAVMFGHLHGSARDLATIGVSATVAGIVARAMAKEPISRFPSWRAFIEACAAAGGTTITGRPTTTRFVPRPFA